MLVEMIQRFEETSPEGKRNILQIMKPWLRNIELVEESTKVQLPQAHVLAERHQAGMCYQLSTKRFKKDTCFGRIR